MQTMITKRIVIQGHVQDVFFRASTKKKADELGVRGTVRNCKRSKKRVHVIAQGQKQDLEKLIEWCHQGPTAAIVDSVEVFEYEPKNFADFSVIS